MGDLGLNRDEIAHFTLDWPSAQADFEGLALVCDTIIIT